MIIFHLLGNYFDRKLKYRIFIVLLEIKVTNNCSADWKNDLNFKLFWWYCICHNNVKNCRLAKALQAPFKSIFVTQTMLITYKRVTFLSVCQEVKVKCVLFSHEEIYIFFFTFMVCKLRKFQIIQLCSSSVLCEKWKIKKNVGWKHINRLARVWRVWWCYWAIFIAINQHNVGVELIG